MTSKEEILSRYRANVKKRYDMPRLDDIAATTYDNPLEAFCQATKAAGGNIAELKQGDDLAALIAQLYPDAREIASNLPEAAALATRNPDTAASPQELDGTDVGIVRGRFGVAENGCVWIPQHMQQKAVCFISENLVILLDKSQIVSNMHEAYRRLRQRDESAAPQLMDSFGYGTFISGPSKTADIAQVLVMGAQAARTVTVVLTGG